MTGKYCYISFGLLGFISCATVHAACSSTCPVSTHWDIYGPAQPGWNVDLLYSYSRADTLRSGSNKISANTGQAEVENLGTVNKMMAARADYTFNEHWGIALHVPYIMRQHEHNLGPYTGNTPAGYESFDASGLGDVKLIGRYQRPLENSSSEMGVRFGFKLNTGKKYFTFEQSGEIPGEPALQPGNGSTDLILGVFWHQVIHGSDWSGFAQGTLQDSIRSRDNFTPGNQVNLDGGTRYAINSSLHALLQLNAQWNDTDSGSAASLTPTGEASSGGHSLALTPGLSYSLAPGTQLYGLLQLPLYQYVNGEQLTADSSFSLGLNHRF